MKKIKDCILLHKYSCTLSTEDLLAHHRFRLFKIAGMLTFIVVVGFAIQLKVVAPKAVPLIGLMFLLFAVLIANYFLLAVHKKPKVTYSILIFCWLFLLHIDTYYSGGVSNAAHFYFPTIILTAYILLGKKAGWLTVLFSMLHVVYFFIIGQYTSWISNELSGDSPLLISVYFMVATLSGLFMLNVLSQYLAQSKNAIIADLQARKDELAHKNEELQRLSLVASQTNNGVVIIDALGKIEWINDGFTRISGYSFADSHNQSLDALLQNEVISKKLQRYLTNNACKERLFSGEAQSYTKEGRAYWMQLQAQCIIDKPGAELRFFCILTDTTEKVMLQQRVIKEKINAQQELSKTIISTQEKERSDIGKELHDNVNQILTTAKLYVENSIYYPEQSDHFLVKGKDLIQKSITEIRYLCKALVTPVIHDLGFKETLFELIDTYNELKQFRISHTFCFDESAIDKDIKLTIYRILQEKLNNAVKYARATEVHLSIDQLNNSLNISYRDNGVGFDMESHTCGLGLNNIKNRAEIYKGSVSIASAPGEGCAISICFPISNN